MTSHSFEQTIAPNLLETIHVSIQQLKGTKRQIIIKMMIPHSVERVWKLITDYDQLADLIPNLMSCRQINQSGTAKHLDLVGSCRILNFWFSIRLVLEATESYPYQIDTQLIDGDVRSYVARWRLEPNHSNSTMLIYTAEIAPKPGMPIVLLERQLGHLLPVNFLAIRQHLDKIYTSNLLKN